MIPWDSPTDHSCFQDFTNSFLPDVATSTGFIIVQPVSSVIILCSNIFVVVGEPQNSNHLPVAETFIVACTIMRALF